MVKPYIFNKHLDMNKQLNLNNETGFLLVLVGLSFFLPMGRIIDSDLSLFIAAHAIGQGAVIWVYISEIFPNHLRNSGQAFGVSVHWVLAAIIPSFGPLLFSSIGAGLVFSIFALFMVLQLIFVHYVMPETRRISLEKLSKKLISQKSNK